MLDDGASCAWRSTTRATPRVSRSSSRAGRVRSVHSLEPTLADVFIHLAGRSLETAPTRGGGRVSLRRVLAILLKDLRDAGRDGRILVLLALPIGMALFYNATIDDPDELPTAKVADRRAGRRRRRRRAAPQRRAQREVEVRQAADGPAARRLVADDKVAFAVVVDRAATAPTPPRAPTFSSAATSSRPRSPSSRSCPTP